MLFHQKKPYTLHNSFLYKILIQKTSQRSEKIFNYLLDIAVFMFKKRFDNTKKNTGTKFS